MILAIAIHVLTYALTAVAAMFFVAGLFIGAFIIGDYVHSYLERKYPCRKGHTWDEWKVSMETFGPIRRCKKCPEKQLGAWL